MTEKITKRLKHKIVFNWQTSIILIIFFAFLLTFAMFAIQPIGIRFVIDYIIESNYLIFLLNFLPIFLLLIFAFFLLNNIVFAGTIVSFIVIVSSLVNRTKVALRQDPFMPWDLLVFNETLDIVKRSNIGTVTILFLLTILLILFALAFNYLVKNKEIKIKNRAIALTFIVIVSIFINNKLYSSQKIYDQIYTDGNIFNQMDIFNSKGFVYCFIYNANQSSFTKINGYKKDFAEKIIKPKDEKIIDEIKKRKLPNIIAIMGEAFSDIGETAVINFDGFTDPLENYKEIIKDSVSGHIVAPVIGGGTADTEFDFLTGINTRNFRGVPYSYRLVNNKTFALPSILKSIGYANTAIHPGHEWFYNRQNVYDFFGFDKFININSFQDPEMFKAMYIKESVTFDSIIEEFDKHIYEKTTPYFNFCVTIQNHGPYFDRYKYVEEFQNEINFNNTVSMTQEEEIEVSNFFYGLHDADVQLKRLIDYFKDIDEPIVVVYFGDHLPAFNKNVYDLIIPEGDSDLDKITNRYSVPFFIWQNERAKEDTNFNDIIDSIKLPKGNKISSFYLGPLMLKLLGLIEIDGYMKFTFNLMEKYPIVFENVYFDGEGNFYKNQFENQELKNEKYLQYYRLFDE